MTTRPIIYPEAKNSGLYDAMEETLLKQRLDMMGWGDSPGYVVPMERKSNRRLTNPDTFMLHHLNFLHDAHCQWGFPYYLAEDFPRILLPVVHILQNAKITDGYSIDDWGFVHITGDEE